MPKIIINDKTRNHILKNGGSLIIERGMDGSSWTSVPVAKVRFGEPEIENSYNLYESETIKVYVVKGLEVKGDSIYIKLSNFLGLFKSIEVSGFKLL